jgi:hypothetical protein
LHRRISLLYWQELVIFFKAIADLVSRLLRNQNAPHIMSMLNDSQLLQFTPLSQGKTLEEAKSEARQVPGIKAYAAQYARHVELQTSMLESLAKPATPLPRLAECLLETQLRIIEQKDHILAHVNKHPYIYGCALAAATAIETLYLTDVAYTFWFPFR